MHYYKHADVTLYNGNCIDVLPELNQMFDMVITSPPYDNLRDYDKTEFDFIGVANTLKKYIKDGGVIVWIVTDATVNGSETGTSFKQALYFIEIGFNLHDTMIYHKNNGGPPIENKGRYRSEFEYMFVFSKGAPKVTNLIADRATKSAGNKNIPTVRQPDGSLRTSVEYIIPKYAKRGNIWSYNAGYMTSAPDFRKAHKHPSIKPIALAKDHIVTWSNPGDIILDPMAGSGTSLRAAKDLGRKAVGIELHKPYCDLIVERMAQDVFI